MNQLPRKSIMLRAFREKDRAFDGVFYVGVKTTGIFCRPVCRAKPARPRNLEFFDSPTAAQRQGYRACKLCRPVENGAPPPVVQRLLAAIETHPDQKLTERAIRSMGIDPSTARRRFQEYFQMTVTQYQRARRIGMALHSIKRGKPVIGAQLQAGYASGSGFREAFARSFGKPASRAAAMTQLWANWIPTPLGTMIGICHEEGIVLCDFTDRRGLESAIVRVRQRFAEGDEPAAIVPGDHPHLTCLARELSEYFAGTRRAFTVPVQLRGTAFEVSAWKYLRTIPFGQTRTYSAQARALGNPQAVRAVGRANGMNYLEIIIPCHRVLASTGKLAGYGGGLARKRWLLAHESQVPAKHPDQPPQSL